MEEEQSLYEGGVKFLDYTRRALVDLPALTATRGVTNPSADGVRAWAHTIATSLASAALVAPRQAPGPHAGANSGARLGYRSG